MKGPEIALGRDGSMRTPLRALLQQQNASGDCSKRSGSFHSPIGYDTFKAENIQNRIGWFTVPINDATSERGIAVMFLRPLSERARSLHLLSKQFSNGIYFHSGMMP